MANAAITVDLNARIAQFETEMKRATSSLDKFGKKGDAIASGMSRAFGAIGAVVSVGALAAFAKSGIDAADSLNDMSQRLGVSVKDLASFQLAAEQSGTSLDGVGLGIARLTKNIGLAEGGNKQLAKALQDLGITARDPKEAFFQLADATERITDPAKRAALLSQVLGKSYQDLIPLLAQGGDELRRSAQASESFSDAMARLAPDADKFNDQLAALKINAAGASAVLLANMVPSLNEYLGALQKIIHEGTILEKIGFFTLGFIPAHILDEQATSASELGDRIASYRKRIAELKDEGKDASAEIATMNRLLEKQIGILNKPPKRTGGSINTSAATSTKTGSAKASDPLASLLGSTEIGKTKEYEKMLGLLNARFDNGKKNAELYKQAVEALNKQFGQTQIDVFGNGSFFTKDQGVADFIKQQEEAVRQMSAGINPDDIKRLDDLFANTDASRLLKDQEDMVFLTKAFNEGIVQADGSLRKLSETEYLDAVNNRLGLINDTVAEMDTFATEAAKGMQNAFADFLMDPFESGLQGMVDSFTKMLNRMVAEAIAADLARKMFGSLAGGSGDGMVGDWLMTIGSAMFGGGGGAEQLSGPGGPSFDGGGFTGDGSRTGGVDGKGGFWSVLHPQETVIDHAKGQKASSSTAIYMTVNTPDANSFRKSQGQITAQLSGALSRGRRNM